MGGVVISKTVKETGNPASIWENMELKLIAEFIKQLKKAGIPTRLYISAKVSNVGEIPHITYRIALITRRPKSIIRCGGIKGGSKDED